MKQVLFLTGNVGKFHEAEVVFQKELPTVSLKQDSSQLVEIQSDDLEDVARFKLESFVKREGKPVSSCITEDAGFFVTPQLKGFPGVYSAYVQKVIGNAAILKLMEEVKDRRCNFQACIAFYSARTRKIVTFSGMVEGTVSFEQRGTGGFGFDPIFLPNEIPDKTFAELSAEEKSTISHRGRALMRFIGFLKENLDAI
ncbi:MAG: Ham1-like protein [Promethearchaeota archaeon CR_4]|nr:MAG: Ham1-like protein [Candidatus Lokiarchaeota archaeon CR_4]